MSDRMQKQQAVNRTFKSSVFVMLFSDAGEALKLYNAVNGTDYKDPEEMEKSQGRNGKC